MDDTIQQIAESRRRLARKLGFFDAGIWLGQPVGFPLAEELKPEQLDSALRRSFTSGGLVSHWRGATVSAQEGNLALEAILPNLHDDTFVVWTGLPLYPAEPGPLPGQGNVAQRVRGIRIFPKSHGYPLADWTVGSLCAWLIERGLPLFLWHVEVDWPSLRDLARKFPKLIIILETQTKKILYHTRPLFALMQECSNLLLETSNFVGAGFLEYAVREFGDRRLIFGSFQPINDPLVPIGMILDADISDTEKAMIAGGNLRAIISEVRP
jgi:hypothetical protein